MRTLAIGDIHGCHTALVTLLDYVKPEREDQLVFLGDYVDRGPASKQVIETLLSLKRTGSPIFLRGNHEEMLLMARQTPTKSYNWQSCGGLETLISYEANDKADWVSLIPTSHWEFFEQNANFFETKTDIFVHGCVDPELDMKDQNEWLLLWQSFPQLREPHRSGKRVVCGHTEQKSGKPANAGFAVCIDTGAAYGNWLTCLDSNSGKYWQANEEGKTREGML